MVRRLIDLLRPLTCNDRHFRSALAVLTVFILLAVQRNTNQAERSTNMANMKCFACGYDRMSRESSGLKFMKEIENSSFTCRH